MGLESLYITDPNGVIIMELNNEMVMPLANADIIQNDSAFTVSFRPEVILAYQDFEGDRPFKPTSLIIPSNLKYAKEFFDFLSQKGVLKNNYLRAYRKLRS